MLACREITELVTDYVEGRMPLLDRIRFWMHVGMCGICRRYVAEMRLAIASVGRVPTEPPPPAVLAALQERFRSWKGRRPA